MSRLVDDLLALHGLIVYTVVGLLVFAEDAFLIGLVVPGDVAAILGGVAASRTHVAYGVMTVVVVIAAIVGDAVGYLIGRRFGPLHETRLLRHRRRQVRRAQAYLARRGGAAVFFGRFISFMRTLIPFMAGSARMPYGRFTSYNVSGAVIWGVGSVLLGFLAAHSYRAIVNLVGPVTGGVALAAVLAGLVVWRIRRRRRRQERDESGEPDPGAAQSSRAGVAAAAKSDSADHA